MDRHSVWPMLCVALWTSSITLMLVASFQTGTLQVVMAAWSLLIAIGGGTVCCKAAITGALRREQLRIEELASVMAAEAMKNNGEIRPFRH